MLTLLIGGAGSGKSELAESLLLQSPDTPRIYLATMEVFGAEGRARVERHRALRAGKGFETVERLTDLSSLSLPSGCSALLEDLGNLTANELYRPDGAGPETEHAVLAGISHLLSFCRTLIVVSNEVFTGGTEWEGDTLHYLKVLAAVHRALARQADRVAEVVCGRPVWYKGGAL